jgi:hypothetical protein
MALTYNKYDFLKELGIGENNFGCYHGGKWCGSGKTYTAVNPTTGEKIANI